MLLKDAAEIKLIERMAKALGDKNRLKILECIASQGMMNCTDCNNILDLAQPSISHHIKTLVDAGILETEKEGRYVNLSLNKKALKELISYLEKLTQD